MHGYLKLKTKIFHVSQGWDGSIYNKRCSFYQWKIWIPLSYWFDIFFNSYSVLSVCVCVCVCNARSERGSGVRKKCWRRQKASSTCANSRPTRGVTLSLFLLGRKFWSFLSYIGDILFFFAQVAHSFNQALKGAASSLCRRFHYASCFLAVVSPFLIIFLLYRWRTVKQVFVWCNRLVYHWWEVE